MHRTESSRRQIDRRFAVPTTLLLVLVLSVMNAPSAETRQAAGGTKTAAPQPDRFLTEYTAMATTLSKKFVALANALPADQYDWRPARGVRSISEVLMHTAQTNFGVARSMGLPMPEDLPEDLETITDKSRVVALVEQSFVMTHQLADGLANMDLSQSLEGQNMSIRGAMLFFAEHHGEHLGQLVAYSRSVGVVPPWSK